MDQASVRAATIVETPAITVRRSTEADRPRWCDFVADHPQGRIYHHPDWLRVLTGVYGYEPLPLLAERGDGGIAGVLPLAYKRGALGGRRLSSLPHTPLAGPLARDSETLGALLAAAGDAAAARPGTQLQLKVEGDANAGAFDALERAVWPEAHIVELPERPDDLRFGSGRNHQRIKWAVGKAERAGVQVRAAASEDDLRHWHRLYAETMRALAVPPHPFRFFRALRVLLPPESVRLLLAERKDGDRTRILAGSLLFMFGSTVFYAFNGLRRDAVQDRPNDLLQWHALRSACEEGYRRYDMGAGLARDAGLTHFKRKWGAHPVPRYRYYSSAPESRGHGRAGREVYQEGGGMLRAAGDAAWRRMPVAATTLLGGWMYRYL